MTEDNVGGVIRAGAAGVAVISAIAAADDIALLPDRSEQRFGGVNGATDLVKESSTSLFCCLYSQ